MLQKEFTIMNKLGLHARAAASLVKVASGFKADVRVGKDDLDVNGKSIMGVLLLAAGQGSSIRITTDGPDEQQAMQAIGDLINDGFGEIES